MDQPLPENLAQTLDAPCAPAPGRVCHSHWMGHLPFAFWLIRILRPRLLVELGAYQGASFCAFCQEAARLGLDCEAYAIDTWQGDANMGSYPDSVYEDLADYIKNHYQNFACLIRSPFDQAVSQFEDGSIDLLHIDGFHGREAILADFATWLPKMSPCGVVLLHDIRARLPGYGGVAAWQEISARFPSFAFNHGYGLGVVLTGNSAPEPLQTLCALDEHQAARFRCRFQGQAAIYDALFGLEERRLRELAAAGRAAEELRQELAAERERAASERAAAAGEKATLQDALLQASLKAQAYEGSVSWKITAPLRKFARFLRS
ncbi:MAG: class I SAM-dependent methyltransferase [Desulfovibrio sp.]|nr:class I SAM-dependent methyltransferase [Desulfovibrio sp.]